MRTFKLGDRVWVGDRSGTITIAWTRTRFAIRFDDDGSEETYHLREFVSVYA